MPQCIARLPYVFALRSLCLAAVFTAGADRPAAAQEAVPTPSPTAALPPAPRPRVQTSVSLGAAAQLTATRTTGSVNFFASQGLDPTAQVLGAVRQSFRPWLGYTVNLGYTRTNEQNIYAQPTAAASRLVIPVNVYETTFAYLAQHPVTPRLTGFADLGGGVLTFLPANGGGSAAAIQARPLSVLFRQTGVAGFGVDYSLNTHFAMRVEYRGLLFKYPDFGNRVPRQLTVTSEPTLSLTYNFGKKH